MQGGPRTDWKRKYNHTGEDYFNLCKKRPFARVMDTAKKMIRDALPIRCLEAVFLAAYLTCGMEDFSRIPVSFKVRPCGCAGSEGRRTDWKYQKRPRSTGTSTGTSSSPSSTSRPGAGAPSA